jgi:hypothetical protein
MSAARSIFDDPAKANVRKPAAVSSPVKSIFDDDDDDAIVRESVQARRAQSGLKATTPASPTTSGVASSIAVSQPATTPSSSADAVRTSDATVAGDPKLVVAKPDARSKSAASTVAVTNGDEPAVKKSSEEASTSVNYYCFVHE